MITDKTKKIQKAAVNDVEQVSNSLYYITFTPEFEVDVAPGQYVSILCDNLTLRRPFSIMSSQNGKMGILFKKKGAGTEYISKLKQGDILDFIGPLGNGYNLENKKSLLIGAGVGVAPIFYLQQKMFEQGVENLMVAGFMAQNEIPVNVEFDEIITNDGSIGLKGSVLDYVEEFIEKYQPEKIYSCGPTPVLKAVSEIAKKYSIPSEIAMEKVMACGIGVCRGCVIKVLENNIPKNATVCKDGPVFSGDKVIW